MENIQSDQPKDKKQEIIDLAVDTYKEMRWAEYSPEEILEIARSVKASSKKDPDAFRATISEAHPDIDPDLAITALKYMLEHFSQIQALAATTETKIPLAKALELGFKDRVEETLRNGYKDPDIENNGEPIN